MMANETYQSRLLDCASEIRNVIYGYVLTYDHPLVRGEPEEGASTFLALLRVSKSVEREAAPIFYERNLFRFNCRHVEISSEHNLDQVRAKEGLSLYDDAQMICPIVDVPKRHINSLRNVSLIRELSGYWPNGPLNLGSQSTGILDLEDAINFLATRNTILNSLSITLKRTTPCGMVQWDPDPSPLLRELDAEIRISTAVGKLANLSRLEIYKHRVTKNLPKWLRGPLKWTPVQPEALSRVKVDHFAKAKAVLYTRRVKRANHPTVYGVAEVFLIDFQQMGVNGRKPEYQSELELELERGDDGTGDRTG